MIKSLYKPFQYWSDGGSVWIISDPHFDDYDTKLMNPNWISSEEHIEKINKKVFKNDTLICLGDCGNLERFKSIRCKNKVLIKGNHDDKGDSKYEPYFSEIYKGALFISPQILLSHEPVVGVPFAVNIHGHVHNGSHLWCDSEQCHHMNIASDVANYEPFNLGELIKGGLVSDIPTIHRITIDKAIENPIHKKS